jgi:NDP-sugar pyrophosphorylase family protein
LKMPFHYKVVILAAGLGNRLRPYTDIINKAIVPVNEKAAISYIIEKFPLAIEIVIAVGYKGEVVKTFLECAHKDRKFTFVDVDNFDGVGSGPGYSLLCCKRYLDCPFVFFSVDTLVLEDIPEPRTDWLGVAPVRSPKDYCTVYSLEGRIKKLFDKVETGTTSAFIGVAGVYSYLEFFNSLSKKNSQISGEKQVSDGFSALLDVGLSEQKFTWFDLGNIEGYKQANKFLSKSKKNFDFSKSDEFLYIQNGQVIKFFADNELAHNRFKRASLLKGLVPDINFYKGSFYSYIFEKGKVAYDSKTPDIVVKFFDWAKDNLWIKKILSNDEELMFINRCNAFYCDKTYQRLNDYYSRFSTADDNLPINNNLTDPLDMMLKSIPWDSICHGKPGLIHGDLQFDNILELESGGFKLLDWRQDFSGLIDFGDIYYDLAKLYGGLQVSYKAIKSDEFEFKKDTLGVYLFHEPREKMASLRRQFQNAVAESGYDFNRIRLITSLIFLNMSPLHHEPFSHYLFYLGKLQLSQALETQRRQGVT